KDRRILGEEGFISVVMAVDAAAGKVVGGPEVHARGFAEDDALFDDVTSRIKQAVDDAMSEGVADLHQLEQVVRRTTGKWVNEKYRRRPMIIPVVVAV
ncbi:MAG: RNase J family beta-CASP ribonuclease, partial [Actinomycetales bacterium]